MTSKRKSEGPAPPRKSGRTLLGALMFATAGAAAWMAAEQIAVRIETTTAAQARAALADLGLGWANVATDGLALHLSGTAPDEIARFRALSVAGGLVDERRVVDGMTIARSDAAIQPDFKLELLRQGDAVSLIGLIPAEFGG